MVSRVVFLVLNTTPSGTNIVFVVVIKMPQLGSFHREDENSAKTGSRTQIHENVPTRSQKIMMSVRVMNEIDFNGFRWFDPTLVYSVGGGGEWSLIYEGTRSVDFPYWVFDCCHGLRIIVPFSTVDAEEFSVETSTVLPPEPSRTKDVTVGKRQRKRSRKARHPPQKRRPAIPPLLPKQCFTNGPSNVQHPRPRVPAPSSTNEIMVTSVGALTEVFKMSLAPLQMEIKNLKQETAKQKEEIKK